MFKEVNGYIKAYLKIAQLNRWLFFFTFATAVAYKVLAIVRPFIASLIVKALTEQNVEQTYYFIGLYLLIYLIYRFMLFLNYRAYSLNVSYSYRMLQDKIFEKLISIDGDFTRKVDKGKLMNTINTDTISIGEMNDEIAEYFTTIFQLMAVVLVTAYYNIPIAILMTGAAVFYSYYRTKHDREFNKYWWKVQIQDDKYTNFLNQIVDGLQEVKTFNMTPKLREKLSKIEGHYDKVYQAMRRQKTSRDGDVDYFYYAFHTLFYIVLIFALSQGNVTIDIFILLMSYHAQIEGYCHDFIDATIEIRLANAAIRRVNSILHYKTGQAIEFGKLNLDDIDGVISVKNISLKLNGRQILKNINFKVKSHEFVAIVGFPGAGKTKLFDLLLRLNQPDKGQILLDGININEFSREVYTSNVAVANQIPFIFNTSIRKNLDFVDTDIKRQIEACRIAGIHDFIETLPQGYNTILRENANNISGGQRQMISIARTILTDAEILLLDDVTTSLDPDTATLVPRLIKRIKNDRTIIMITKKPELMKTADRIIVLDNGKISDIGTHEKLLERNSVYRALQAAKSPSTAGGEL